MVINLNNKFNFILGRMNSLKRNFLFAALVTTSLVGCKKHTELRLVEFKGIYPKTPAHQPFCELYFLDSTGAKIDSTSLMISEQVSDNFRLRKTGPDSLWIAPNRFAVAELVGEKGDTEKDERIVTRAKAIDSSEALLGAWQKRIVKAKGDPEKVFGIR